MQSYHAKTQCKGQTKKKKRCRNRTTYGEFCYLHGGKKSVDRRRKCEGLKADGTACGLTLLPGHSSELRCSLHIVTRYDLSIYVVTFTMNKKVHHGFFNSFIYLENSLSAMQNAYPNLKLRTSRNLVGLYGTIAIGPYKEICYTQYDLKENECCSVKVVIDLINEFMGIGYIYIYSCGTNKQNCIKNITLISPELFYCPIEKKQRIYLIPFNTFILSEDYLVDK
uniref:Zn-finger protein n=1 Tax=Pithovirus LCPAC406 TaxID=2506599 RepID=A0A481ZHQ8_9VIRU|nr:MAG: uncharacterized protein LCPAC406_00550 [Pithovirus LCPAC406]